MRKSRSFFAGTFLKPLALFAFLIGCGSPPTPIVSDSSSFRLEKIEGVTVFINRFSPGLGLATAHNGNDRVVKINITSLATGANILSQKYVAPSDAEAGTLANLSEGDMIRVRVDVYKDAFSLAASCLKTIFGAGCTIDRSDQQDFTLVAE